MKYIKQLDAVRAIAVIFVVIHHFLLFLHVHNSLPVVGRIGVDTFFVMSGFLITRILFDNRDKAMITGVSTGNILKQFYIRRTLRIFPIYYLTIFVLLLFPGTVDTHVHRAAPYLLTYTSNFYFFKLNGWDGVMSHVWSLAVEEQFYLLWPLLVLLVPRKYFLQLIVFFIGVGVVTQFVMRHSPMADILPFYCFDAFGLGALLAWQVTYRPEGMPLFYKRCGWLAIILVILYLVSLFKPNWIPYFPRTTIAVVAAWLISFIVLFQQRAVLQQNWMLNNRVLIFLGKISYGLYLYHMLIPTLNLHTIDKYINPHLPAFLYRDHWAILFNFENLVLLVLVPWLSFVLIETPFLRLKKYFEYQKEDRAPTAVLVTEK